MDINNDLLTRMLTGDSCCKVSILQWKIKNNIIKSGNNFTSELSRLIVEYQRKGKTYKKSFILKVPSTHPMYQMGSRYKLYDKEYPIYTTVLEEMYRIDGEHIGPRLYYADDKNSLILKDLSQSGYKLADRVNQLDYEHCNLVFKKLAKFHALSIKLNETCKLSTEFRPFCCLEESFIHTEETKEYVINCCNAFRKICPIQSPKLATILSQAGDDYIKQMADNINPRNFKLNAFIHGDCWTGNTLFKYDKYGMVKKMKLIDFQKCYWTSPAVDILYFTITSMQFEVFEKHFDFLLETYVKTLNKILRHLQYDAYTLEELRRNIDELSFYAISTVILNLPQHVSSHENPLNFSECIAQDKNGTLNYNNYLKIYENKVYISMMEKWISYFKRKGYLD